jgi:hypothetical protein
MRAATSIALALLATLALTACGESDQQKAENTVCDARAGISKQVDALKSVTPSTFTVDDVSKRLSSIRGDLKSIKGAQQQLGDERRAQVKSANQAFEAKLSSVRKQLLTSLSTQDAKAEVTTSLQQLATTYKKTYAKVDCS